MIAIKTNKKIGTFLQYSRIDNRSIRTVESLEELSQYEEGIDYELIKDIPVTYEDIMKFKEDMIKSLEKPKK